MSKNYSFLDKATRILFTMCLMFCLTSCEDLFGEWDKPAVKQAVETIVNVTGADPSDVTAALKAIVTDEAVAAAAAKGEPIKVTVTGSGVSTDATDKTITIPQKSGAAIEISFATAPTGTDSNSLVLETSEGAGSLPSDANNNLIVSMPSSEGLAIIIELPQTTVTLKTDGSGNVVYKDVVAKTALSTIIIDKGVTIKEHELVGGNIVVNNGGAIETIAVTIKDNDGMVCLGSWWSGVGFKENGPEPKYEIKKEDGGYYLPKNLRIKKGAGDHVAVSTNGPEFEYIDNLIIGEGVTVGLSLNSRYKVIKGEGNNKSSLDVLGWIHASHSDWEHPSQENVNGYYYVYDFDSTTEKVSNVSITEKRGETNPWNIPYVDQQTADYSTISFNLKFQNKTEGETVFTFDKCDFPAKTNFNLDFDTYKRDANGNILYEDVTLYCCYFGEGEWDITDFPTLEALQARFPEMTTEVGDRERGGYWTVVDSRPIMEDPTNFNFKGILVFNNCTINGTDISTTNFPKLINSGRFGPGTVAYQVKIGNTTYNVNRNNDNDYDISLIAQ